MEVPRKKEVHQEKRIKCKDAQAYVHIKTQICPQNAFIRFTLIVSNLVIDSSKIMFCKHKMEFRCNILVGVLFT